MIFILVLVLVPAGLPIYLVVNNRHRPKLESPKFQIFNITAHKFDIQNSQLSYNTIFNLLVRNRDSANQLNISSNISLSVSNISVGFLNNIPPLFHNSGQPLPFRFNQSGEKINFLLDIYIFKDIIYYFQNIKSNVTIHSLPRPLQVYNYPM